MNDFEKAKYVLENYSVDEITRRTGIPAASLFAYINGTRNLAKASWQSVGKIAELYPTNNAELSPSDNRLSGHDKLQASIALIQDYLNEQGAVKEHMKVMLLGWDEDESRYRFVYNLDSQDGTVLSYTDEPIRALTIQEELTGEIMRYYFTRFGLYPTVRPVITAFVVGYEEYIHDNIETLYLNIDERNELGEFVFSISPRYASFFSTRAAAIEYIDNQPLETLQSYEVIL